MNKIAIVLIIILAACQTPQKTEKGGFIDESWINERVESAKERLLSDENGAKVWESIEAHGGLRSWFGNGPIRFQFDYQPVDGGTRRNTVQTIEQWSVKAVHELPDEDVSFGWDGAQAWVFPDTAVLSVNARFWSKTPFYFIGLPFVLADEGIKYSYLSPQELDGEMYDLVKVSYDQGVGDASGDFYVIYINQKTKLMGALRYIVSYPGFFPNGGHSNEKFMKINSLVEVDGIQLPTGYKTYWWVDEAPGEHITNIAVSDYSFHNDLDPDFFDTPAGAKVLEGL